MGNGLVAASEPAGLSSPALHLDSLRGACQRASQALLAESTPDGWWVGELSTSALSTATAVMALEMVRRQRPEQSARLSPLIDGGLSWLAGHQNPDGGWGDTTQSFSNISTTMLAEASFVAAGGGQYADCQVRARAYIDQAGGVPALRRRYGKDKTFSVPILTHCALAGLVSWKEVPSLPFELGWLPHQFYKWVRLPVVSYALPALIAIGQTIEAHRPTRIPLLRSLRRAAKRPTLKLLTTIQPESGGFLEAAPLTSFVTMSLAGMGRADHPVAEKGIQFLVDSVRPDGSWPIDTNLATWATTLSVNALSEESLPREQAESILNWLLAQQYRTVHPYTQAAPGGWAWTDLSGGVPDADDTPGAMLAVMKLARRLAPLPADRMAAIHDSLLAAAGWLINLQNRNGGWPTFCRGWGTLPFDRSSCDLTAHAIRALEAWLAIRPESQRSVDRLVQRSIGLGLRYLRAMQAPDGGWRPLWFGNQHAPDDENPVYGTARVLMMYRDLEQDGDPEAERGREFLSSVQNDDGGWGGSKNCPSSVEETALATEVMLPHDRPDHQPGRRGLQWLIKAVETEKFRNPSPIGFYFAKLWYFERVYPMIFTTSALNHALYSQRGVPAGLEVTTDRN